MLLTQAGEEGGEHEEAEELDPSKYYANRIAAVNAIKQAGGNPYPHKFHVGLSLSDFIRTVRVLFASFTP
jgi:hypothetical protein